MKGARILIVEDEAIVAMDIRAQLSSMGYETVGTASTGENAVALARTLRPDLVLMDINLAGAMDGVAAAQVIRTDLVLPVVFLTAFSSDAVLARAKLTDPSGFILKPFSEPELRTVIEMALYRSQSDARLRESEQHFRAIFDAEPECVKVVSPQGAVTLMNAAGLAMLELDSLEQALSMRLVDFLLPEYHDAFKALHQKVIAGGTGLLEFEITGMRGTRRWLETHAAPLRDASGQVSGMLGVTRDMTERKQARQQRRVSDQILSAVSQGVIISGVQQNILSVNDAFLKITGFSHAEVLGQTCKFMQGPLTDPDTLANIRKAIETSTDFAGDILNYRKDGTIFWNELTISPVRDDQGQVTQFVGIVRDISERKHAESEQREYTAQLQALSGRVLEAQETERRRVAHELHDELGQSLTAIKINLQAYERLAQGVPDGITAENIRIVEDALKQVRGLAAALRPSMLDDLGLVPALGWMTEQNAMRSGIAMVFECPMPQIRLSADIETACFRIVQEALTNIVRHAQCSHVHIQLIHEDGALVLSVADNGCGFDVTAMRLRAKSGASMGVLGMQERATLIGGTLTMESATGRGSILTLRCPLRLQNETP
jgi:PAS domain S-box-containing protein